MFSAHSQYWSHGYRLREIRIRIIIIIISVISVLGIISAFYFSIVLFYYSATWHNVLAILSDLML